MLLKMIVDVKQLMKEIKKRKIANQTEIFLEEINLLPVKDYISDRTQNYSMKFQSCLYFLLETYDNPKILDVVLTAQGTYQF